MNGSATDDSAADNTGSAGWESGASGDADDVSFNGFTFWAVFFWGALHAFIEASLNVFFTWVFLSAFIGFTLTFWTFTFWDFTFSSVAAASAFEEAKMAWEPFVAVSVVAKIRDATVW